MFSIRRIMRLIFILLFSSVCYATPSPTPGPVVSPSPVPPVLKFTAASNGVPPMAISPNPLTITQNGVTTNYNLWVITGVTASGSQSAQGMAVPLTVTFQQMSSSGQLAPLEPVTYTIPNILTDGNLTRGIAAFFQELSLEAFQVGTIR